MAHRFTGIYPAIVTPFDENLNLDLEGFEKLVDRLYLAGVQGFFVGGNIGEWYTQTIEERKKVVTDAVKLSKGRGKVIFHVGCTRISEAVELAHYGEKIGVDALGSLPPYQTQLTEEETIQYFKTLAQATDLPLLIYYHPVLTRCELSERYFEIMESIPAFAGVKYTDYDLLNLINLIEFQDRRLSILNGHDQVLFPSLKLGVAGGIGSFYNIIPRAFVRLYKQVMEGHEDNARLQQQEINHFIRLIKKYRLIPALKFILQLNNIGTRTFRAPMLPLTEIDRNCLERELNENEFYNEVKI